MNNIKKRMLMTPFNILYELNPEAELKLLFRLKQGYRLNLKRPQTYNEKLQWIKLYDKNPMMAKCVDKYQVRRYIADIGCGEILNELLWEGFDIDKIPFDDLPNKFVIKVTHGSTFNIICTNKSELNRIKVKKKLKKWIKEKFLPCYGEWFYGVEKPRIIIEKFIESNEELKDFKVFCFNGIPRLIAVYSGRNNGKVYQEIYDTNWNLIKEHTNKFELPKKATPKPDNLSEILNYATKISSGFKHVRVDFFNPNNRLIFGEMTFTSSAGFGKFSSHMFEIKMGNYIELPTDRKNDKMKILMLGPARSVKGGMTSVVDNYFEYGLDKIVNLKYIETTNDKNVILKILKMMKGFIQCFVNIKKYDIIHIHVASRISTFRKGIYVRLAKKYKKKIILHIHGAEYKIFLEECNNKKKKYIIDTLNLADKIIVLSEEWKDFFKNYVNEDKIKVIYNSIVIPEDFDKNIDTNKILFLGRIGKRKGIYDLIDAFQELVKLYPKLELFVGGDGEQEKLKDLILEKKLENNVSILGWISGKEKEKLLRECSIYILPSYNEGMPMSLLEGMAYKNVPISTKVGGIPKVIENMENGILIEAGDKEKLYNSVKLLLSDKNLRNKLSNNARKTIVENFNIKINIKRLVEIYTNE